MLSDLDGLSAGGIRGLAGSLIGSWVAFLLVHPTRLDPSSLWATLIPGMTAALFVCLPYRFSVWRRMVTVMGAALSNAAAVSLIWYATFLEHYFESPWLYAILSVPLFALAGVASGAACAWTTGRRHARRMLLYGMTAFLIGSLLSLFLAPTGLIFFLFFSFIIHLPLVCGWYVLGDLMEEAHWQWESGTSRPS
jgi:hypothetical protein